jgi:ribonuclease HII
MNSLKEFDLSFIENEYKLIAGVDEAGRGPLAGPVVAAAVIFDKETFHTGINDSKKLKERSREELFEWITGNCISFGIGIIDHLEIDEINILQASLKAMKAAVNRLSHEPALILIDGNKSFKSEFNTKTIVKGDSKSFSIAAASIIAKVTRDRIMRTESEKYPNYLWAKNKGYATKAHIDALLKYGAVDLHRKTFLNKIFERQQKLDI